MTDVFTIERRSLIMSRIRSVDTAPELAVRRIVHSLGYRFRLHRRDLPGTPDLTLTRHRKVIFVHGCFWHGHVRCRRGTLPATNQEFWRAKISANKLRDRKVLTTLRRLGWSVLVIWQCEMRDAVGLNRRLQSFLGAGHDALPTRRQRSG
jgi:DNA mismatch endonuclease, patch repair protein